MAYTKESSRSRTPLAIALIVASFLSAFFLASFSNRGDDYWVVTHEISSGHQLLDADVATRHVDLDASSALYIPTSENPVGLVTSAKFQTGQLLGRTNISSSGSLIATSAVPISIRASDVAVGISQGEAVDIYWVIDSQNGEFPTEPVMILGGVILLSFDAKSKNFGTDASLTLAVDETQVLHLLHATTHGRLVVVGTHV